MLACGDLRIEDRPCGVVVLGRPLGRPLQLFGDKSFYLEGHTGLVLTFVVGISTTSCHSRKGWEGGRITE